MNTITTAVSSKRTMKSHIPIDLIADILCRLPVKSVVRFLCVSKSWAELIKGLGFINTHLQRSINSDRDCTIIIDQIASVPSLNFLSVLFRHDNENCLPKAMEIYPPLQGRPERETTIVDYCNGLVCLHNCVKEIALWNPLIRKYKKLPSEPVQRPSGFEDSLWSTVYAFGHDPHNDDYKVVRIAQFWRLSWVTPGFSQSRRCKTTASERDVIRLTIGRIGGRPSRPRRAMSSARLGRGGSYGRSRGWTAWTVE